MPPRECASSAVKRRLEHFGATCYRHRISKMMASPCIAATAGKSFLTFNPRVLTWSSPTRLPGFLRWAVGKALGCDRRRYRSELGAPGLSRVVEDVTIGFPLRKFL